MTSEKVGRRQLGLVLAWVCAAVVAVTVGVVGVNTLGDTVRDRGPLGNEVIRTSELEEGRARPHPDDAVIRDEVTDVFGTFVVECRGVVAYGIEARPDRAAGWRVVSYEPGPDDDVDAVFSNGARSVDLEVFCNRGQPTVADFEFNQLPEDD